MQGIVSLFWQKVHQKSAADMQKRFADQEVSLALFFVLFDVFAANFMNEWSESVAKKGKLLFLWPFLVRVWVLEHAFENVSLYQVAFADAKMGNLGENIKRNRDGFVLKLACLHKSIE